MRFAGGTRGVERIVIATLMQASGTTVFIIDPPNEETPEERERRLKAEKSERISEKLSDDVWFIPRPQEFELKVWDAQRAQLLKWAGQYRSAAEVETSIEIAPRERPVLDRIGPSQILCLMISHSMDSGLRYFQNCGGLRLASL